MLLLAAKQWHAWVAFPLFAGGIAAIAGLAAGYVRKVIRPKYPR